MSTGQHAWLNTYTPKFGRHLHHIAVNGFFARDLDADDHAFLEYVRVRGIANGTLDNQDAYSLEEMAFWQSPYTLDQAIARRHGPVPMRSKRPEPTLEQTFRKAQYRARLAQRVADKALAKAELERENEQWRAQQRKRELRAIISDHEWELFGPKRFAVENPKAPVVLRPKPRMKDLIVAANSSIARKLARKQAEYAAAKAAAVAQIAAAKKELAEAYERDQKRQRGELPDIWQRRAVS
jgi:hypothetical protein